MGLTRLSRRLCHRPRRSVGEIVLSPCLVPSFMRPQPTNDGKVPQRDDYYNNNTVFGLARALRLTMLDHSALRVSLVDEYV